MMAFEVEKISENVIMIVIKSRVKGNITFILLLVIYVLPL
jgi:hypothetical protein